MSPFGKPEAFDRQFDFKPLRRILKFRIIRKPKVNGACVNAGLDDLHHGVPRISSVTSVATLTH